MKKIFVYLFISAAFINQLFSQTVTTIVKGPSTFNDGLALDKNGNIYASLYYGSTVTKITPAGVTSIFAKGLSSPNGLKFGHDGNLYVPSAAGDKIHKVTPEGVVTDYITIDKPSELYFDKDGLLYVTNYADSKIYTVDANKNITTLFSGGLLDGPIGIQKDDHGNLYIGNFNNGKIYKVSDGQTFIEIASLPGWLGFMTLVDNYIYATAYQDQRIYKVAIDGSGQSVFAGSGTKGKTDGPALEATFNNPNGITASSTGDTLYISDYTSRSLRMITGVKQTTTDISSLNDIPLSFELEQNYPNPFNPSTTIKFDIKVAGNVILKVYNSIGKEITTLLNGDYSSGSHSVNFVAENLASGIYFYKLSVDNKYSEIKKMLFLK